MIGCRNFYAVSNILLPFDDGCSLVTPLAIPGFVTLKQSSRKIFSNKQDSLCPWNVEHTSKKTSIKNLHFFHLHFAITFVLWYMKIRIVRSRSELKAILTRNNGTNIHRGKVEIKYGYYHFITKHQLFSNKFNLLRLRSIFFAVSFEIWNCTNFIA